MTYKIGAIPDPQSIVQRASTGTVGKSSDDLANGVLSGYEWSSGSITYAFPASSSDYGYSGEKNHNFAPVNGQIQDAARWALDQQFGNDANDGFSVEGFTKLDIGQGGDKNADIRYGESSSAKPAYAYLPTGGEWSGDVWIGKDPIFNSPEPGNYAFMGIVHETGHALGLKHGHIATKGDPIKTTLEGKYDSVEYSVMTYHSYAGQKVGGYTNEPFGYSQTFMMADIRALQHMYGADFTTNSENTVYSWKPGSGDTFVNGAIGVDADKNRIFATIWDGGGEDTYNLSAYSSDLSIDLRPGEFSIFKKSQLADLDQFSNNKNRFASGNIYNALLFEGNTASLIENAIGGAGDDLLRGNSADNKLTGNGGHDVFFFRAGGGSDQVMDFTAGDKINLAGMGLTFADIQALGADSAGDFLINFGNGDTLRIENRLEASLASSDFVLG